MGLRCCGGEYCDLVRRGIADPTKVVRTALENGASVAGVLITTDAAVAKLQKDKKEPVEATDGRILM